MMPSTPDAKTIANTSPLLYLHQVGHLDLLKHLYQRVIIPRAVQQELQVGQERGVNVPVPSSIEYIQILNPDNPALIPNVTDLGQGEAEVIALGIQYPGSLIILDDQLGRKIAKLNNLKYTGTLGVLIKAKRKGHLTTITPILKELRNQGMWLSDRVVNDILILADE